MVEARSEEEAIKAAKTIASEQDVKVWNWGEVHSFDKAEVAYINGEEVDKNE